MSSLPPIENKGSDGWLLFGDEVPTSPEALHALALANDCEPEEADAIAGLAKSLGFETNPYVIIDSSSDGVTVDVIVPPEDIDVVRIYMKYNTPVEP